MTLIWKLMPQKDNNLIDIDANVPICLLIIQHQQNISETVL